VFGFVKIKNKNSDMTMKTNREKTGPQRIIILLFFLLFARSQPRYFFEGAVRILMTIFHIF
jgi:hypothetical protein